MFFSSYLNLPLLTLQTAIFGFPAETDQCTFKTTNYLLLIFKMCFYKSREKVPVNISRSINDIRKIKAFENLATNNTKKLLISNQIWRKSQSNKFINIMLEIQRMKLFLTENIYAFTLQGGLVSEKVIFTSKNNMLCLFCFIFLLLFLVFNVFPLVVSNLFCFNFFLLY